MGQAREASAGRARVGLPSLIQRGRSRLDGGRRIPSWAPGDSRRVPLPIYAPEPCIGRRRAREEPPSPSSCTEVVARRPEGSERVPSHTCPARQPLARAGQRSTEGRRSPRSPASGTEAPSPSLRGLYRQEETPRTADSALAPERQAGQRREGRRDHANGRGLAGRRRSGYALPVGRPLSARLSTVERLPTSTVTARKTARFRAGVERQEA